MKFTVCNLTPVSITFELENQEIYQVKDPFDVLLNGKKVLTTTHNVFSLFDLKDDEDYVVTIGSDSYSFHTPKASYILHVKDFLRGFKGEDQTLPIQTAISYTPRNGLLVFEEGEYPVTSLFFHSQMTVYLKKGAVIKGNPDVSAYPLMPGEIPSTHDEKPYELQPWEGNPFASKTSLINVIGCEDVAFTGEGVLDGQAQLSSFWIDVKKLPYGRPRMIFVEHSDHVTFNGITVKNSPAWTIHPYFSDNLGFYDMDILNPKDAPNTDGIDPECCDNIQILGIRFSVGDDCIALKSGKIQIGKTFHKPLSHCLIRNCFMNEGHGAVVLGSEAGAGIKDLTVERCYFKHTDRGLRIKSRRGRGKDSILDNVVFKDIRMDNVLTPLVINMFYFCDPDGKSEYVQTKSPLPVDERTPYLGHFTFERIVATDCEVALGFFYGLPEQKIASITIKDSTFTVKKNARGGMPAMLCDLSPMAQRGFLFCHVGEVTLDHVSATGYIGEEVELKDVSTYHCL